MKNKHNTIHGFLIKIGIVIGVVVLFFVVIAIHRETLKKNQIQAEINKLREEATRIARENSMLQEKIDFLASREYMETEARDKLNLKSPDEQMVIVKKNAIKESIIDDITNKTVIVEDKMVIANYIKWWNYFFKY